MSSDDRKTQSIEVPAKGGKPPVDPKGPPKVMNQPDLKKKKKKKDEEKDELVGCCEKGFAACVLGLIACMSCLLHSRRRTLR